MLDFVFHYPLRAYWRGIRRRREPLATYYLGSSATVLALIAYRGGRPVIDEYNAELNSTDGAPTLASLDPARNDAASFHLASSYTTTIAPLHGLHRGEDSLTVVDDRECYVHLLSIDPQFAAFSVAAFRELLHDDPLVAMPAWSAFDARGAYIWEILTPSLAIMDDNMEVGRKVVVAGYPETKADFICEWGSAYGGIMRGIVPAHLAALWVAGRACGSRPAVVLLMRREHGMLAILQGGAVVLMHNFRDSAPDLQDLSEILFDYRREQPDALPKDTPMFLWGGNDQQRRQLSATWPSMPRVSKESLDTFYGLSLEEETPVQEVWLLAEAAARLNLGGVSPTAHILDAHEQSDDTIADPPTLSTNTDSQGGGQ